MSTKILERPILNSKNTTQLIIASSTLALTLSSPFITNELAPTYINTPSELINTIFANEQQNIDMQKLVYSIRNYGAYENNWDGYNGTPPKKETIRDTISFLKLLPSDISLPFAGLSGDGEINLFWDKEGVFIDIGFTGDNKFSYYAKDAQGKEFSGNYILISSTLPSDLIQLIATTKL